jgi:hypothetical protein
VTSRDSHAWQQIGGNVSQSDCVHYETDELLGSAAQADRIRDQATIRLATEDEDRSDPFYSRRFRELGRSSWAATRKNHGA